jgi:DNA polymerase III subunit delta
LTPDDFLRSLEKGPLKPAYLFIGPEAYQRERCRNALIERALSEDQREQGLSRFDLDETDLAVVLDDARSFSLFATERLIWVTAAEGALPRTRSSASEYDGDDETRKKAPESGIAELIANPTPGVVVVFDCSRYEFDGDDKAKLQRVQKFYGAIQAQVEFEPFTASSARILAQSLAREKGVQIAASELDVLVDVLGADASRIAIELEKLAIFTGGRKVTAEDIWNLVPSAKAATIFQLVAALGRGNRAAALEAIDVLVREGEYLPLALTFLATQFRLALAAKEANVTNVNQIQSHFTKLGTPMWRSRAEQVQQTISAFTTERLRAAMLKTHETDKALRDANPDDRIVMERFVFSLT